MINHVKYTYQINNEIAQKMSKTKSIFIYGYLNDSLSIQIISNLLFFNGKNEQGISLILNSNGSNITDSININECMNYIYPEVYTVGIGNIMDSIILILANGKKDSRAIFPNAKISISKKLLRSYGKYNTIQEKCVFLVHASFLFSRILNHIALETHYSAVNDRKKNDLFIDKNRFFSISNKEALSYGIIDKVLNL